MGGKAMFARVSTYKTGPDSIDKPADDVAQRVLAVPGCLGIYYLTGTDSDKALSITLWETEDAMTQSKQTANQIRSETSSAQKTEIVEVEMFEVTMNALKS
jgi:heme-degrading monooxygenase HmoA